MSKALLCFFDCVFDDFKVLCEKFNKLDVYISVQTKIKSVDERNECSCENIIKILERGNQFDLRHCIGQTFANIPLGLQAGLERLLLTKFKDGITCINTNNKKLTQIEDNVDKNLNQWKKWRSGNIHQSELFASVNESVVIGDMNVKAAQQLTELILGEAGYHHHKEHHSSSLSSRMHFESTLCDLHQLSCLFPHGVGKSATMYSYNGESALLARRGEVISNGYRPLPVCRGVPSTSSEHLHWEQIGGGGVASQLALHSDPGHSGCRQLLQIGDSIRLPVGFLDVDEVIAVDCLRSHQQQSALGLSGGYAELQHFVILVEGRVMHGAAIHSGEALGAIRHCHDGVSELGVRDDVSHSSEGSVNENENRVVPLSPLYKRYFCMFVAAYRGVVHVQQVVAMQGAIAPDQVPTRVLFVEPCVAVVSGSNGLLGTASLVAASPLLHTASAGDEVVASYTDLEKDCDNRHTDIGDSSADDASRRLPIFRLLTEDSLAVADPQAATDATAKAATISHAGDATVVATSYSAAGRVLFSGDTAGVVCAWSVNAVTGKARLSAAPVQLGAGLSKLCYLQASPSGTHVAAALWDRLLVLHCAPNSPSQNTGPHSHTLFVRSCLDASNGLPAKYTVAFPSPSLAPSGADDSQQFMRVWRVTKSPFPHKPSAFDISAETNNTTTTTTGARAVLSVTTWLHTNVDQWRDRHVHDQSRVEALLLEHSSGGATSRSHSFSSQRRRLYSHSSSSSSSSSGGGSGGNHDEEEEEVYTMDMDAAFGCRHSATCSTTCDGGSEKEHRTEVTSGSGSRSAASSAASSSSALDQACYSRMTSTDSEGMLTAEDGSRAEEATKEVHWQRKRQLDPDFVYRYCRVNGECVPVYQAANLDVSAAEGLTDSSGATRHNSRAEQIEFGALSLAGGSPGQAGGNSLSDLIQGMLRPLRGARIHENSVKYTGLLVAVFGHDCSERYLRVKPVLAVYCACLQAPSLGLLAAALDRPADDIRELLLSDLNEVLFIAEGDAKEAVQLREPFAGINRWLCTSDRHRIGRDFWIDAAVGHNRLCALYLRHCGNKSVAVEHPWQDYLRTYGPSHLRRSSRGLRQLTAHIRKIDETANIKHNLPHQIGYISGLQEIYARRVGLGGRIPMELGQLSQLRVLSMGNNHLYGELPSALGQLKHLQRIVLHQNNLQGVVPSALGELGCIVNLAGNPRLQHGPDVPDYEREALVDLFTATRGPRWNTKAYWCSTQPVAKWYKVGVLSSRVHSIVMSSNGMEGRLPASIASLTQLRMIELATMPGLIGPIPKELCNLTTLRRLCICRCGLSGRIPSELGNLVALEELQLFGNMLTGAIPASIGNLTNLKLLSFGEYTGGNNFAPAPLPACLASLVNLEALFMANCYVRGPLPSWIGNLRELRQLDLQHNSLSGHVPPSIGRLENLLYLNIKDNEALCGRLPIAELSGLTKLNRLSLVHCNFADAERDVDLLKTHLPRCKIWI